MFNLHPFTNDYEELLSQGWEWVVNCSEQDADNVIDSLSGPYEYRTGDPKPTTYSSEQLKSMGMVGIYSRKQGGRPVKLSLDPPQSPTFLPQPDTPEPHTVPMSGTLTDKPPAEILAAA